jgi:site-specific recombinase XerD
MSAGQNQHPLPLFDTLANIKAQKCFVSLKFAKKDFNIAREFLLQYDGSEATFNAYRRDVEKFLHWCWLKAEKPALKIKRVDIEEYIKFCQKPPKSWIGIKHEQRYVIKTGQRIPNKNWHPFVVSVSKTDYKKGIVPDKKNYEFSQTALKDTFAILSSFYNYLIQENLTEINPILQIRQKSKFIKKTAKPIIRRLSESSWEKVISTAKKMAAECPKKHERTLFIITALYLMYLRISELTVNKRWSPKMCDFFQDHEGLWWFVTVGKGNKERHIAVSSSMLSALKHWRKYLNLTALPTPNDKSPLLPKEKGQGGISSACLIRRIVQVCFDRAITSLKKEEAEMLAQATVHWLRHTGISDDVKHRPREHVRDDAGHSSSAITDKYIDVEKRKRHKSAKNKTI